MRVLQIKSREKKGFDLIKQLVVWVVMEIVDNVSLPSFSGNQTRLNLAMYKLNCFIFVALIFLIIPAEAADNANIKTIPPERTEGYLLFDNFNADASDLPAPGWSVAASSAYSATVEEVPFPGDKSLRIRREDAQKAVSIAKSFMPASGTITAQIKIRCEESTGTKTISLGGSGNSKTAIVKFRDGNIVVGDGHKETVVQSFMPGIWYIVRLVLSTHTQTYDVYVDGIKEVMEAKFTDSSTNLSSLVGTVEGGAPQTLYIDNVKVYSAASLIGKPPSPVFDVIQYGAVGDGRTLNTKSIQKAIDACAGSGGSVYIHDGKFVTGTIVLKSKMTLFVDSSATLFGSANDEDYPSQGISDDRAVLIHQRAMVFANGATDLKIDGGGTIDGNGYQEKWKMNGSEFKRQFLLNLVHCQNTAVQNVCLKDSSMWCFVPVEVNNLTIRNIDLDSRCFGNRDGIDIADCQHVLIEGCTLNTDDDSICPKSGILSGLDDITVRDCTIAQSVRASGIKFGTASYGQFKNALFEDILIKNCDKAALGLESVDGSDIAHITYRRIDITNTNSPFYITIGRRGQKSSNDTHKIGSVNDVHYEDINGKELKHNLGCPLSGLVFENNQYRLTNLSFVRCHLTFLGGLQTVPPVPPEMGKQYPECNNWGPLPAFAYFIRHADHVCFMNCTTSVSPPDSRPPLTLIDVTDLTKR